MCIGQTNQSFATGKNNLVGVRQILQSLKHHRVRYRMAGDMLPRRKTNVGEKPTRETPTSPTSNATTEAALRCVQF
jgi:hypothetical protein